MALSFCFSSLQRLLSSSYSSSPSLLLSGGKSQNKRIALKMLTDQKYSFKRKDYVKIVTRDFRCNCKLQFVMHNIKLFLNKNHKNCKLKGFFGE